jgi:hypothetical protein
MSRFVCRAAARLVSILFVLVALAGCATGPEIRSNQDPAADFGQFRTFGFAPAGPASGSAMLNSRLVAATTRELEARGLQFVSGSADLVVSFYTSIGSGIDTWNRPMVMMPVRNYGSWAGYRPYIMPGDPITEGTLGVHVIDRRASQLVWEGIARDRVTESMQDNPAQTVNELIAAIFGSFPL